METVYLGRDNVVVRELIQDGQPPVAHAISRVVARIGSVCIDSQSDDEIQLDVVDVNGIEHTHVTLTLGHLNLSPTVHKVQLTAFDANHPDGIAWDEFWVYVKPWQVCE